MSKKVKLAIFDRDLKARAFEKFGVSKDGSKISVRKGGKRNFNPTFDNDSFIEFPRRSLIPPFRIVWDRVYFARNMAKACVRFRRTDGDSDDFLDPDPEQVMKAAENQILEQIGTEKQETPMVTWVTLAMVVIILLKVLGVIV